jgi:hypothetical protein
MCTFQFVKSPQRKQETASAECGAFVWCVPSAVRSRAGGHGLGPMRDSGVGEGALHGGLPKKGRIYVYVHNMNI